jgi:hypothetical protein
MPLDYEDYIEAPAHAPPLQVVVRNVLMGSYPVEAPPAGFEAYFDTIMAEVVKAEPRAWRAARDCEVQDHSTWQTPLQKDLRHALARFFEREHPDATQLELRAEAFGRTIAAAVHGGVEQRALYEANLRPLSDHEKEWRDAEERDQEFERNRRRPRKPLYRV